MDGARNHFLQYKLFYIVMVKNGWIVELMDADTAWLMSNRTS